MIEDTDKRVTLRVPEELHKPARTKIAALDTSFQAVLLDLLAKWTGAADAAAPQAGSSRRAQSEDDEDLDLLRFIKANGTKDDVEWIRGNLINFGAAIRARSELNAEERRMVEEYRTSTMEKQRRMRAFVATPEDLGPERMPAPGKQSGHRKPG